MPNDVSDENRYLCFANQKTTYNLHTNVTNRTIIIGIIEIGEL